MNRQPADFFRNLLFAPKAAGFVTWARSRLGRTLEHRKSDIASFNDRMLADIGLTRDQIEYGAGARHSSDRR